VAVRAATAEWTLEQINFESFIVAVRAATAEWTLEQIIFVAGRRGAVEDRPCL